MQKPHGLLLVDKPSGMTSHDVVDRIRRVFNMKEVGHSGTLDPIASGLMVMLLGEGTKLSQYILERNKGYEVKIKLGVETDSFDRSGMVVKENMDIPSWEEIQKAVHKLSGLFDFPVPVFSATRVQGKKLYEYAHAGVAVEVPKKPMEFFDIEVLQETKNLPFFSARLRCSKGSFIRSWVQQLGMSLGCGATVYELRRLESEPFDISQALKLEEIEKLKTSPEMSIAALNNSFIPLFATLPHFRMIRVSGQSQHLICNGQISHDLRAQLIASFRPGIDEGVKVMAQHEDRLLAIVGLEQGKGFVVKRVFQPV